MATATMRAASYIAPTYLYSLRGFQTVAGISPTRMREARKHGITCPTLEVGRRKFVRGSDGIGYLERLATFAATSGDGEFRGGKS